MSAASTITAGSQTNGVYVTHVLRCASPKYRIRGVPTLLMIKNGEVVGQQVGAVPKAKIQQLMDQAL